MATKYRYTNKTPIMLEVDGKYRKILPGDEVDVENNILLKVDGKEVSWFNLNGFEEIKPKAKPKAKAKPKTTAKDGDQ